MKLNIPERYTLIGIIPERGNFETMSLIEGLQKLLYPSEKEVEEYEVKQENDLIKWNVKGMEAIEIELSKAQKSFLVKILEDISTKDNLTFPQYSILKKLK